MRRGVCSVDIRTSISLTIKPPCKIRQIYQTKVENVDTLKYRELEEIKRCQLQTQTHILH